MGMPKASVAAEARVEKRAAIRRGEIHRLLHAALLSGAFPAGSALPPERDLMVRYRVTRTTIRRALAKLVASGHLTCQPRMGYRVSPAMRNGRPVKGCAIGLILYGVPEMGNGPFASAVEEAVSKAGHVLMVGASGNNVAHESDVIRRLAAGGMEGLIIRPACLDRGADMPPEVARGATALGQWIRQGRPVAMQGHPGRWALPDDLSERCSMVDADNEGGIRLLLERLAALGHRTAGFICQDAKAGSERFQAFKRLAPEFGIRTRASWCVERVHWTTEHARPLLTPLLRVGGLPTALLCSHDDVALPLLELLREQGMRCPDDISVTGFENRSLKGHTAIAGLTTIDGNSELQGREAMRMLAQQFAGRRGPPERLRVPVTLVDRGSIGRPQTAGGGS